MATAMAMGVEMAAPSSSSTQYTPDERSKGVRLAGKRIKYDTDLVHSILNSVPILHVSFNAPIKDGPPFPTILPMLGAVGAYPSSNNSEAEEPAVYLHGSSVARLFRLTEGGEIPLSVCGTFVDGYVLALAPFHNSCNYRSAVVFGYGNIVEDDDEVEFALRLITNNSIPERWENSRSPPKKEEIQATAVLKVRIETASAKVRTGGPSDEKADLQNPEVANSTWTGVVPTYFTLGDPIAREENKVKAVPEYLQDWVADATSLNQQNAVDAVLEG